MDLHGNVRKNPKLSGTTHNVFGIQVGVGITILVKKKASTERFVRYHRVPEIARKIEKLYWLEQVADLSGVEWQTLAPNAKNAWITEGLIENFDSFLPLGTKEAKAGFSADARTIFKSFSNGVKSNRDDWVYGFDLIAQEEKLRHFIDFYNSEVERWQASDKRVDLDNFVNNDEHSIKWSEGLKASLKRGAQFSFSSTRMFPSLYRPFCKQWLYFDTNLIERIYKIPRFFPNPDCKNRLICLSGPAHRAPFTVLMTDAIPNLTLNVTDGNQCFPLHMYSADGTECFDNITSFALQTARKSYGYSTTHEDVFYATYALLHHPTYRIKYAENLKRELPRLPLGTDAISLAAWKILVEVGRKLGDLHVNYESATPYPLDDLDTTEPGKTFSFHVERMRFDKAKTQLKVNDSIMLSGFIPEMFEYKLGNRSALDWVVDSYRVKRDDRSGLVSDPNRPDEPRYIIDLICRVATVSLETQKLIAQLPPLFDQA